MLKSKFYVYGDQNIEVPAHLNFGKYLLQRFSQFKEKTALINGANGQELKFRELLQLAVNISDSLLKLGVDKKDTVGVCGERHIEFLPTALGVICTGATFTPMFMDCGRALLHHNFSVTRPKYVICTVDFWNRYHDVLKSMEFIKTFITFDRTSEIAINLKDLISENVEVESFEPVTVQGQVDTSVILYSSGTTGMPKGVMLTHLNALITCRPHDCDKSITTYLCEGKWCHNYDLFKTLKCLASGKTMVFDHRSDINNFLEDIQKYKVEMLLSSPVKMMLLAKTPLVEKYDLSSIKLIYSRSSPLHADTIKIIKERIPNMNHLYQGYGMTESGEPTSESRGEKGPKAGSVGTPCPGTTFKVVNIKTEDPLGPNKRGEIRYKGLSFMKGYIGLDPSSYLDKDGFFKTGDMGYYDEDKYFYIVGRLKEMISYKGFEISPLELETLLARHPGVRDVGVISIPDPNLPGGELAAAGVVKQSGSIVTEKELADLVEAEAEVSSCMEGGLYFLDKIPRNDRGKILRNELREIIIQKKT